MAHHMVRQWPITWWANGPPYAAFAAAGPALEINSRST
jgi:hypothetical protein